MSTNPSGGLTGSGVGPSDKGWSYKHQDLMNLTAVRRVVDLDGGEDPSNKDCFAMVCRTNEVFDLEWEEANVKAVKKRRSKRRKNNNDDSLNKSKNGNGGNLACTGATEVGRRLM